MSDQDQRIIVIGASAGGYNALKTLIGGLPADFPVPLCIVWHIPAHSPSIFPDVLNKLQTLHAAHAIDGEPLLAGRIYIAPPDRHLLVEKGRVRITRGPKENWCRPAVDPLFRSAAYAYGAGVTGIILSGALDDGAAGLWSVKNHGGTAIVQEPGDAEVSSMPENALKAVAADYLLPVADIAPLLVRLSSQATPEQKTFLMEENERIIKEVHIAMQDGDLDQDVMHLGDLSPYTCPECSGVLTALKEGGRIRFRCHTGHAFSADSLLANITENIEQTLWTAIRAVEESVILLNHMGDHLAEQNQLKLAAVYFQKAAEARERMQLLRKAVLRHEQLSTSILEEKAREPAPL